MADACGAPSFVQETPFFRAFGLSWLEDSAAAAAAECPRLLAPSKPVRQILGADREHLGRAVQSTGVYMEERREGEACPGCGDSYPLVLCAARHITMEFLRDSAVEFVVGGALAPKALFVAGIFHETRAPWVPATVSRSEGFPLRPCRLPAPCSVHDLLMAGTQHMLLLLASLTVSCP